MTRIVVAGAGSIGCFVGGCLELAGRDVRLLARPRVVEQLGRHGLRVSDYEGLDRRLPPAAVRASTDPVVLADAEIVLVTVKARDTAAVAEVLHAHAPRRCVIASLQNGVRNRRVLADRLPHARILSVMVSFNVVHEGKCSLHRATEGELAVQRGVYDPLAELLDVPGLGARLRRDIDGVLWGKLLLNLNNALNALSGLPLREELADPRWRRLLADMIDEGLAATRAAGIRPRRVDKVVPAIVPPVLRLPTPLFRRVAASMMAIDPTARSSMWDDLQRGQSTEVAHLQGEIVALGARHGVPTPINRRVQKAIQAREGAESPPTPIQPEDLG